MVLALLLCVVAAQPLERLVYQLGAERLEDREAAMRTLHKVGKKALPALRKATQSRDPEIAARARFLLGTRFRFFPGYTVDITVFGEPELSIVNLAVPPDGYYDIPYIGRVKIAGRTPAELKAALEKRLKRILKRPRVEINTRPPGFYPPGFYRSGYYPYGLY